MDYFHEKLTLVEDVGIDQEELIDLLIDGVSEQELRNQARMQCFATTDRLAQSLFKAYPAG